jgi:hypothetical protein
MWFIVTLCGADSRHDIETQLSKIAEPDFQLEPQEVTMNHITIQNAQFTYLIDGFS